MSAAFVVWRRTTDTSWSLGRWMFPEFTSGRRSEMFWAPRWINDIIIRWFVQPINVSFLDIYILGYNRSVKVVGTTRIRKAFSKHNNVTSEPQFTSSSSLLGSPSTSSILHSPAPRRPARLPSSTHRSASPSLQRQKQHSRMSQGAVKDVNEQKPNFLFSEEVSWEIFFSCSVMLLYAQRT